MLVWTELFLPVGIEARRMKRAQTNHEFAMLLMLLMWLSLVLGVAVAGYWLSAIVQSTRPLRLPVLRRWDNLPRAAANRTQKRYDPGPMPQPLWPGQMARANRAPKTPGFGGPGA
jgi:hypothetical protein